MLTQQKIKDKMLCLQSETSTQLNPSMKVSMNSTNLNSNARNPCESISSKKSDLPIPTTFYSVQA
jgi:hypothetical protein